MIDLTLNNSTNYKAYDSQFFVKIFDRALKELKLGGKKIGLSVNLVGPMKMKSLNKKYCDKDKVTDVLSFSLSTEKGAKNKGNAIVELGDIFICPQVAQKKAKETGQTLTQELEFLAVHGFLHLLGYDHEKSQAEEKKMFDLQARILKKL